MVALHYEMNNNHICKTDCPFGLKKDIYLIKVGSTACFECKYHKGNVISLCTLYCTYPDHEIPESIIKLEF